MVLKSGQGDGAASFSVGAVAKGVLLSFVATLLVSVFLGIAVYLTRWEGITSGAHWFAYASIGLGGMLAARHSRKLGWLHGVAVGAAYFLAASFLFQPGFEWHALPASPSLAKALGCLVSGAAGGILGVNV